MPLMSILQAVILGIVEGLSEFLPISSTAHMILASTILHIAESEFVKSFEIVIQLGAILAAVAYYWNFLWKRKDVWPIVIVAFLPTAVIGLLVHGLVKTYLLGNVGVVIGSLFFGGIALIVFEVLHRERDSHVEDLGKITYTQALLIGLFQSLAIIPGVSRSAATIVGGLMLGIRRRAIVDFSFILAIPTMVAAAGLDALKSYHTILSGGISLIAVGFVTAFIVALASIAWLLGYVRKHTFISFGIYRIVAAVAFAILLWRAAF